LADEPTSPRIPETKIKTTVYFLKSNKLYETEKPYALRYASDGFFPQSNMEMERHESIVIKDLRQCKESFSFEQNGFAILKLSTRLAYQDYYDNIKVRSYFRDLEALLKSYLNASRVEVFRHGVRRNSKTDEYLALLILFEASKAAFRISNFDGRAL
jgi:hypothetical protein